jgi:hypothetical protein
MSLLMDAPPVLGVLEGLEALAFESMSVACAGDVLRTVGVVRGRVDVVHAKALAVFSRGNGALLDGATDTAAWLAAQTRTSGRDAKRAVKRAKVLDALPALGEALAAGEISAAHVDEIASTVPAALLPKAGKLVAEAKVSTPEELARKAHQMGARPRRRRGREAGVAAQGCAAGVVLRSRFGHAGHVRGVGPRDGRGDRTSR